MAVNERNGKLVGSFPVEDEDEIMLITQAGQTIRLPVGGPHKALLVTERALVTDQGRKLLYVVNERNEVVERPVTLGALHDGMREIITGLSPDDRVIVNGLQRVRPGVPVDPKPGVMNGAPVARAGSK